MVVLGFAGFGLCDVYWWHCLCSYLRAVSVVGQTLGSGEDKMVAVVKRGLLEQGFEGTQPLQASFNR